LLRHRTVPASERDIVLVEGGIAPLSWVVAGGKVSAWNIEVYDSNVRI
jgi:hypothetical protein